MKKLLLSAAIMLLGLALIVPQANAQTAVKDTAVSISTINDNPGFWPGKSVIVEGLVTEWVENPTGTNYFILKGNYGGIITVNTAGKAPEPSKKYRISGIVYIDQFQRPFISEKSREMIGGTPLWLILVLGGAVLVIIVVVIILIVQSSRGRKQSTAAVPPPPPPIGDRNIPSPPPTVDDDQEFETIRFSSAGAPQTMKFIPGMLVMISGADTGKSFRIMGYPTPEGDVVTLGREDVKGDRAYAHIRIDAQFRTVGRKQLRLLHQGGKLFVQNLGKVNPTMLDGFELQADEMKEVKPGSVIRTGELEFEYRIQS